MKLLLGSAINKLTSAILPYRCMICEEILGDTPGLCTKCWTNVRFIEKPFCSKCSMPFEYDMGDDGLCGRCIETEPKYNSARSLFVYDDHSKKMILKFKHGDAIHSGRVFADWIVTKYGEILAKGEVLVPVPIHWSRLLLRTYNQANVLAKAIHTQCPHLQYLPAGLQRIRRTQSQGNLSKEMRLANIKGSIVTPDAMISAIKNKRIILIDDVMTSGITVSECVKALKKAGAKSIDVLTLSMVVKS